jgi:hypothetical protein
MRECVCACEKEDKDKWLSKTIALPLLVAT